MMLISDEYNKWRLTYQGGTAFIDKYVKRFTTREDAADFNMRKEMSYCPAFAKQALVDIRNAIFQRLNEITRIGDQRYIDASKGDNGGVDGRGTTLQHFLGSTVLDELLPMGKVIIWIDNTTNGSNPYLYLFKIEDLVGVDDVDNPTVILLRDTLPQFDELGLVATPKNVYRYAKLTAQGVEVTFLDMNKSPLSDPAPVLLKLTQLPVVFVKIKDSLLRDAADYQVSIANIASSDMNYILRANFPFYVEQYDVGSDMIAKQLAITIDEDTGDAQRDINSKGVEVGVTAGRRYPKGVDAPQFISPPTDPIEASMKKQTQLKEEIRLLVNLALSNMSPTRSSSESKKEDNQGLESGLSYIGQELERAERVISLIWHMYLGSDEETHINYPKSYTLKSDEQRQLEANKDLDMVGKIPSLTAQKELTKRAMGKLFGTSLDTKIALGINAEIDEAEVLAIDPLTLHKDLEAHLVGQEYASGLRGYPAGEAKKAADDHTAKLSRIAVAQSEAALISQGAEVDTKINTPGISTGLSENEKKRKDAEEKRDG